MLTARLSVRTLIWQLGEQTDRIYLQLILYEAQANGALVRSLLFEPTT